jgi:hypothetical protein
MKKTLYFSMSILLTAWGCADNDVLETADTQRPIEFATYVQQNTRATELNLDSLKSQGFGVYAYATDTKTNYSGYYIENAKVTGAVQDDASTRWTSATTYYWPESASLRFYAYAPYSSSTTLNADTTLTYTVSSTIADQKDLLYATSATREGNKVTFAFAHALACVGFRAEAGEKFPDNLSVILKELKVSGYFPQSSTFNLSTKQWGDVSAPDSVTYTTQLSGSVNVDTTLSTSSTDYLMVIPSTVKGFQITGKYDVVLSGSAEAGNEVSMAKDQSFTATVTSPTFEKATAYVYTIKFNLTSNDISLTQILWTVDTSFGSWSSPSESAITVSTSSGNIVVTGPTTSN